MKNIFGLGLVFLLILGIPFSTAFTSFFITPDMESFSLEAGETRASEIKVSFSSITPSEGEVNPYRIERNEVCNQYDAEDNCIDSSPNLCPYISIEPKNEESTEVGFPLNYSLPLEIATGELNHGTDEADTWNLRVTAPCFEGNCPTEYNSLIRGNPLPPSLKNQTFKCDLSALFNGGIFPVKNITNKAYAAVNNKTRVEVTFTDSTEQEIDPVIIIPGIMGSAYKNGELVIDPILHTYDDLIATLIANGYVEGENLFTFPYEWRDSNILTAAFLRNKINQIQEICDCDKVDIIAHSMGGLVARQYIQSDNYGNDVDQVIFLGTPHRGSVASYLRWDGGEFESGTFNLITKYLFEQEAKIKGFSNLFDYIRNRPIKSIEEILPIFNYIKNGNNGITREYPNNYPRNTFLENLNSNTSKLLNSGVKITNIVGNTGSNTIDKIRVIQSTKPGLWEHGEPEGFYDDSGDQGLEKDIGDNTVSTYGTKINDFTQDIESTSAHIRIPTIEENRIYKILTGKDSTTNIDSGFQISPIVLLLQLQSPIDFVITAPDGKKIGKNFNTGGEYNEIQNAFYSGYQTEEEYITILNPLDGEYKVQLQGVENGGKYGVLTSYISDEFATTTQTTGIIAPNQITKLNVEIDNNNPNNLETEREVNLDIIISDINGAYSIGWIKDKKTRDSLVQQAKLIIKFEKKRSGKFETKVDKILLKLLEKELDLLLKKGKINLEANKLLKADLKYLLIYN